mmetsp:Transcript_6540/g.10684  ORF Transcript_6540/g.10684 Transcript_6540/m.10684 type:complete len:460 (+) Transcript_6540:64-1443(+)
MTPDASHSEILSHHHEKLMEAYHIHVDKWQRQISPVKQGESREHGRCPTCWLRTYDCYCTLNRSKLESRRDFYEREFSTNGGVMVTIYYHFQEIGRSPNTMHLMPLLAPNLCKTLLFGDVKAESVLLNTIIEESRSGRRFTSILYPTTDSMLLPDFVSAARRSPNNTKDGSSIDDGNQYDKPINLVVLDGTYSQARRQLRHLEAMLAQFNHRHATCEAVKLPVVKLLLGKEGCASAIMGIMKQPSLDKICSLQATVLGMRQVGVSEDVCSGFDQDLADWLAYLLQRGVKECKAVIQIGGKKYDEDTHKPLDVVTSHINKKKHIEEELGKRQMKINHTECCAIGSFRVQLLPLPHFIERVHRTPKYQINLVETKKFSVLTVIHKGAGRRQQALENNYKHYKNYIKKQRSDAESNVIGGIIGSEYPEPPTSPCVQVTFLPAHNLRQDPDSKETINFRHCNC